MANRVVLGSFGGTYVLRVSRPGFNVLDDGLSPNAVAFDSRWSDAGNLYMSGSVSISGQYTPSRTSGYSEVMYGRTFSNRPLVVSTIDSADGGFIPMPVFRWGLNEALAWVGTSKVGFAKWGTVSPDPTRGTRTIWYKVYRNIYS